MCGRRTEGKAEKRERQEGRRKLAQSCLPRTASSVPGILHARILEWVAIPFSRGSSPPRDQVGSLLAEPAGKPMEIHPENPPQRERALEAERGMWQDEESAEGVKSDKSSRRLDLAKDKAFDYWD